MTTITKKLATLWMFVIVSFLEIRIGNLDREIEDVEQAIFNIRKNRYSWGTGYQFVYEDAKQALEDKLLKLKHKRTALCEKIEHWAKVQY